MAVRAINFVSPASRTPDGSPLPRPPIKWFEPPTKWFDRQASA